MWSGRVDVEWMSDGRSMRLCEELRYHDRRGVVWVARAGIVVDGASIPRLLWRVLGSPFTGKYRRASVIHDAYCQTRERDSRDVHEVFAEMMRSDGVPGWKAIIMWAAVRWCGPRFSGVRCWRDH